MKKNRVDNIYLSLFYSFGVSLLLLRLPPFDIFSLSSKFATTHVLAKIVLVCIVFLLILIERSRLTKMIVQLPVSIFLLMYFFTSSISILSTISVQYFFQQYQNVILGIIIFIISILLVQKIPPRFFLVYILIMGIGAVIFDSLFAIFPTEFLDFLKSHLQVEMYALYYFNKTQNKFNLYLHTEILLPFLILLTQTQLKKNSRIIFLFFVGLMGYLALFSNFRTRAIQFIFAYVASVFCLMKVFKKSIVGISIVALIVVSLSFLVIRSNTSFDIVDRLIMSDESDVETITYRFDTFAHAFSMLQINPLSGVGLGNYKSYINLSKTTGIADRFMRLHTEETNDNPHSVFVQILTETGVLGFIAFIALLFYFLKSDMKLILYPILKKDAFLYSCIIASWTIFLYGIFNPFNSVFLNGWFWFLRGLIEGVIHKKTNTYEYQK